MALEQYIRGPLELNISYASAGSIGELFELFSSYKKFFGAGLAHHVTVAALINNEPTTQAFQLLTWLGDFMSTSEFHTPLPYALSDILAL